MKNRFWGRPNSIKEDIKLRKRTRRETEIKEMEESNAEIIDYKSSQFLDEESNQKGIEIDEIKEIEIKLENST